MRNKINLIAIVSAAFLANPSADKLIVFDDGNCFLPEDKHHADYHGRKENKKGKDVNREDFEAGIKQLEDDQAAASAKLAADAKAAALKERALNAGLKQNATEDEVIANEKQKVDAATKEAADAIAAEAANTAAANTDATNADKATGKKK